ncbi:unnamed protein product, partial [Ceratitis capitata]
NYFLILEMYDVAEENSLESGHNVAGPFLFDAQSHHYFYANDLSMIYDNDASEVRSIKIRATYRSCD